VSLSGSDRGRGTRESPLRTISRAVDLAQPSDVIKVMPGVYAENLLLDSRGTNVPSITLRGEGTPRPVITPGNRARGAIIRVRGRWTLDNLSVDVGGARMVAVVFERTARKSALLRSELRGGTAGAGVVTEGSNEILIQHNHIHHFIKEADDSHGVLVLGPSRNITVKDNDIHHNSGDSVQCQAGDGPADTVLIESNTMHDEGENAVDIKTCTNVIIRYNTMSGFPNTAVRRAGSSAGEGIVLHEAARGILIDSNVISRAGRGISVVGGSIHPQDIWIEGNYIHSIRNFPLGNGQGIRVARATNVEVVGNTLEDTASYRMMLAADETPVPGLVVRNNTLLGGVQPLLFRLGRERDRPGSVVDENHYSRGGILKADGVTEKLRTQFPLHLVDFSNEHLLLLSQERLNVWRKVVNVDQGAGLLE
jgi:nitrous oxidase accessory protein NosD